MIVLLSMGMITADQCPCLMMWGNQACFSCTLGGEEVVLISLNIDGRIYIDSGEEKKAELNIANQSE